MSLFERVLVPVDGSESADTRSIKTRTVRDKRANFDQWLVAILAHAKRSGQARYTKTSLMLGLGETEDEIEEAMEAARGIGVDIVTMGQWSPTIPPFWLGSRQSAAAATPR